MKNIPWLERIVYFKYINMLDKFLRDFFSSLVLISFVSDTRNKDVLWGCFLALAVVVNFCCRIMTWYAFLLSLHSKHAKLQILWGGKVRLSKSVCVRETCVTQAAWPVSLSPYPLLVFWNYLDYRI